MLPGFGDKLKYRQIQAAFFANAGYDVFIPDYRDRQSLSASMDQLARFMAEHRLGEYEELHVFSYIFGAWVLNDLIQKRGWGNITSILYDRSPWQERAPRVAQDRIPWIAKWAKGKVLFEFAETTYPPVENPASVAIGILIETQPTTFIKAFRKKALSYGPITWQTAALGQPNDDVRYVPLDHRAMYYRFDLIGTDILYFFAHGAFRPDELPTTAPVNPQTSAR